MTAAPATAIGGIDHVVIVVRNLNAAAQAYHRLGFTLSAKGVHSPILGTQNHTIMLRRDYFELLSVAQATERNLAWRSVLSAREGVAGVAFQTDDAAAARQLWAAADLDPESAVKFSRQVHRAGGENLEARFETVTLPEVAGTGVRIFVCSQPTREAVWLPELLDHENTAVAVRRLVIATPDPAGTAAQWLRVLPNARSHADGRSLVVDCGTHSLVLMEPDEAVGRYGPADVSQSPRPVGLALAVADPLACRLALERNGVSYGRDGLEVTVPAEAACGVTLVFEPNS